MNTPAHLIFGAAAFARPGRPGETTGALLGGFAPDASLYLLVGWALWIEGRTPNEVFGTLYFSDAWQAVFAVDNSVFVWGGALVLFASLRFAPGVAFAGSGLLHLLFDFLLHHDDGRAHFWPVSRWIFDSPLSYWDPQAHGRIVGAVEVGVCLILLAVLWRRFAGWPARAAIGLSSLALTAPAVMFSMMFS